MPASVGILALMFSFRIHITSAYRLRPSIHTLKCSFSVIVHINIIYSHAGGLRQTAEITGGNGLMITITP